MTMCRSWLSGMSIRLRSIRQVDRLDPLQDQPVYGGRRADHAGPPGPGLVIGQPLALVVGYDAAGLAGDKVAGGQVPFRLGRQGQGRVELAGGYGTEAIGDRVAVLEP